MVPGIAIYLRHIAVQCVEIARECSDSTAAQKLETLSIELAEKAAQLETLFDIKDEEQVSDRAGGQIPRR
jgi:hypothetical protein